MKRLSNATRALAIAPLIAGAAALRRRRRRRRPGDRRQVRAQARQVDTFEGFADMSICVDATGRRQGRQARASTSRSRAATSRPARRARSSTAAASPSRQHAEGGPVVKFTQFVVKIGKNKTKLFAKSERRRGPLPGPRPLRRDDQRQRRHQPEDQGRRRRRLAKAGRRGAHRHLRLPVPQGDPDGDDDDQGRRSAELARHPRSRRGGCGRPVCVPGAATCRARRCSYVHAPPRACARGAQGVSQRRRRWDADAVPRPDSGVRSRPAL